ncbi:MAG: TonB-dependent receptor [Acidobacteria bacterium]|nr:MAG: TonB-dependent receptor [Acidobacteriota bacterium]
MVNGTGRSRFALPKLVASVLALVGLIVLGNCPVHAQGFAAAITGTVTDTSGAVLPGTMVTVKHLETGLTRAVEADTSGNYSIPSLPVGEYELTAEKMGFQREVRRGINLVVAQEAVLNLTLQVGSVVQQVTVTEEAPLVNTTMTSTSGVITEAQVKELPLNGRSFDQLLTLNVGVSNTTSNTLNGGTWNMFSVAGKRPETNRFILNGIDWVGGAATGQFITPYGASGKLLGVEAMREFNVLTDTYGAEYGKRAGGQISVVTTSGTNRLHGDVFEYLRNSAVDARDFFDQTPSTPPFRRNQFGGALGGPLKKDKLFLFGTYEEFRERLARPYDSIVPDAQARLGCLPLNVIASAATPCPNYAGYGVVPKLATGMLPYANDFWPAPNGPELLVNGLPGGTAHSYNNPKQTINEHFGLARFDYTISSADSFSANYTNDNGNRRLPWGGGGGGDPNFVSISDLHSQTLGLQETHIFSSVVNVATFGYAGTFATLVNAPAVPIPADLVFLAGGNPGTIVIGGGISAAAQSAVAGVPGNNPNVGVRHYFTYSDDVHYTRSKHSLSAGGWIQRVQQGQAGVALSSAGNVAYASVLTFLQDMPTQAIVTRNAPGLGYRSLEAAWYVQDEIKLLRNLTLRLGLRDEMTNGWNEAFGRCTNYFHDANFVIQTNPNIGNSCLQSNHAKLLLQPRVGVAWDPSGRGTWSVRASFGIHNDLLDNLGIRAQPNPPFAAREQLPVANGFLPLLPLQKNVALPPTCNDQLVAAKQNCAIYQPTGFDPNMQTPTIQIWNFTVERQLAKDLMLEVGYVGSQSYHTNLTMDANTAAPEVCQNPTDPRGCPSGGVLPLVKVNGVLQAPGFVPQGTTYMQSRPPVPAVVVNGVTVVPQLVQRPNPYVSNTQSWFDDGTASYHALNVSLVKRATRGLAFKANYSYSKVMDLNSAILAPSGENEPQDLFSPYDRFLNRGPAAYSLNHQFNANFSYQLPFGSGQRFGSSASGLVNQLIGGWQWNGIVTAQGGFPFTPQIGFNNTGTGDQNVADVPDRNPTFNGPVILGTVDHWFDPNAFTLPIPGTFGNVSRGAFRGPGLFDLDTSFFKRFRISEQWTLQFRTEIFNILNHPSFAYPNQVVFTGNSSSYSYSPSAGTITAASTTSRQIQFALKLLF